MSTAISGSGLEISIFSAGPTGELVADEDGELHLITSYRQCIWTTNSARTSTKGFTLSSAIQCVKKPSWEGEPRSTAAWLNSIPTAVAMTPVLVLTNRLSSYTENVPTPTATTTAGDFGPQIQVCEATDSTGAPTFYVLKLEGYTQGTTGWQEKLYEIRPGTGYIYERNGYTTGGLFGNSATPYADTSSVYRGRYRMQWDPNAKKLYLAYYQTTSSSGSATYELSVSPSAYTTDLVS